jgi:hypothetical protein
MSAVTRFFFRPPEITHRSAVDVIAWWEARRPAYNVAVGATGLFSLAATSFFMMIPPHPIRGGIPWQVIVVYGVLANVFYTSGWVAELGLRRWLGHEIAPAGAALFRYGFAFSIGLTFLPTVLSGLSWLVRIGIAIFR